LVYSSSVKGKCSLLLAWNAPHSPDILVGRGLLADGALPTIDLPARASRCYPLADVEKCGPAMNQSRSWWGSDAAHDDNDTLHQKSFEHGVGAARVARRRLCVE
jgi:hypothetical protein